MARAPFRPVVASLLALLLFALSAAVARADGLIIVYPPGDVAPPPRVRPIVPGDHPVFRFAPLEVRQHQVSVSIEDQVAVTKVDQVFYNPSSQRLEGTYLFPIPEGANIDKFTMDINGKETEAELLSADKARSIYEEIVRKTRDPALLEYAGRGLFKVRIFPIEPLSEKRIKLSYTQVLKSDAGLVSYVYPLNTEKFSAKPVQNVSLKIEVHASRPIKSIYCPSHTAEIRRPEPTRAVVGFEARDVQPDTDFQLFFAPQKPDGREVDLNLLTFADPGDKAGAGPGAKGGYFMLMASPGLLADPGRIVQRDMTFVLDTSGSMAGPKIEQAKKALLFCLANLNKGDRFQVVRFSTDVEPLFPGPAEANKENLAKAQEFVEGLKPIGGTAIADAMTQSLSTLRRAEKGQDEKAARPAVVIFLTDGQPTIGETSEEAILRIVKEKSGRGDDRDRTVRVFCFGIGTDVNTRLLDSIANLTGGTSQYVLPSEDLEVKLSSFYSKISQPVLSHVKLNISNVRVSQLYPSPVPDLFQGEQLLVMGRYEGTGPAAVTLEGEVNGEAKKFVTETTFPERAEKHEFIPRLWATRRVGHLLEEIRLHGDNAELRGEATELARRYGIVTPYTSYLIVEDEMKRAVPLAMQTNGHLGRDAEARKNLGDVYGRAQSETSGGLAVGGARMTGSLKSATAAPSASPAGADDWRGGAAWGDSHMLMARDRKFAEHRVDGAATQPAESQDISRQQVRVVNRRTFYQNGSQWIDSQVQANLKAERVQIKVGSPEYFELLKKHPEATAWLSVGPSLQLVLGEKIYDITE